MKSRKLAEIATGALDDLKGHSISCLDVKKLTSITDYMVIATGRSSTHIKALADNVVKEIKKAQHEVIGVEGRSQSEWVLVDCGSVVIHIMLSSVRALYNLEELWNFETPKEKRLEEQSS